MSVIWWKYLDKRSATIAAVKDCSRNQYILDHMDEKICEKHMNMTLIESPRFDGMPHTHNNQAGEERILSGINQIDALKEIYRQAAAYMDWFMPAWNQLSDEEQYVLETFYRDDGEASGAVYDICERYHIERSTAYNRKNKALSHLQVLLYGKD